MGGFRIGPKVDDPPLLWDPLSRAPRRRPLQLLIFLAMDGIAEARGASEPRKPISFTAIRAVQMWPSSQIKL